MKHIKVKEVVQYGGHSLSANGSVNFTLKAMYSELVNTIQLMQMLNNDVTIKAKVPGVNGSKPFPLGMFRIRDIKVDGDGESVIKFNGLNDYIEMDNLNILPTKGEEDNQFVVLMECEVEEEEPEDGDEE